MEQYFLMVSVLHRRRLVHVADVQEIVALMALTEIDGQRGSCRGVMNLRGQIVPVFDLSGPRAALSPSRFILVSRSGAQLVGLIIDEAHHVVAVPAEQLMLSPAGEGSSTLVARIDDDLVSVLDPTEAIRHAR
jgi:purine-binding chemotaxis protein CheW